jgi:hypothetical protein
MYLCALGARLTAGQARLILAPSAQPANLRSIAVALMMMDRLPIERAIHLETANKIPAIVPNTFQQNLRAVFSWL